MKPFICSLAFLLSLFVLSCNNNVAENKVADVSDTIAVNGVTGDSVKLVKTASLNVKVKDVNQGTRAISNLAQQFGGMVVSQNLDYTETNQNELRLSPDSLL